MGNTRSSVRFALAARRRAEFASWHKRSVIRRRASGRESGGGRYCPHVPRKRPPHPPAPRDPVDVSTRARGPIGAGELVQLTDTRGVKVTITTVPGAIVHTHRGQIPHDSLMGLAEGSITTSTRGIDYLVQRPQLDDYVLGMPAPGSGHLSKGRCPDCGARRHRFRIPRTRSRSRIGCFDLLPTQGCGCHGRGDQCRATLGFCRSGTRERNPVVRRCSAIMDADGTGPCRGNRR